MQIPIISFIHKRLYLIILVLSLFMSGCVFTVPRLEYAPPASVSSLRFPTDEGLSIYVGPVKDERGVAPKSLDYVLTKSALGDKYILPVPLAEEVRLFIIDELERSGITIVSEKSDADGYLEATITGFRFVIEWAGALHSNFSMIAKLYSSADTRPIWDSTLKGTGSTTQIMGTKRISEATSQALSQAIGSLGENRGFIDSINQLSGSSTMLAGQQRSGSYSTLKREPDANPTGIYSLEKEVSFNVLDQVVVNPESSTIALLGHHDARYGGRTIPYLQHLAVLMKHPRPQFSLNWTPASERSVDGLFKKLDNPREMVRLSEGPFINDNGMVTAAGRVMLPLLGASPTLSGGKPGYLGVRTETELSFPWIKISSVDPDSPASRAGLKAGQTINSINGGLPYHPNEFEHRILLSGAGSKVTLRIISSDGEQNPVITLDAANSDPWNNLDRFDMISMMFRSAGEKKRAAVFSALGSYLLRLMDTKQGTNGMIKLLETLDLGDYWREMWDAQGISVYEKRRRLFEAMFREIDNTFGFYGAVRSEFNNVLSRNSNLEPAVEAAFEELRKQTAVPLREAMQTVMRRNDEIRFTPEMLQSTFGIRPVVRPEYIDLPADSELAHVMLLADYLGKSLINKPELQKKIPQYQTQYAHQQANAAEWENLSNEFRLWISIDNIDLSQSEDGNTLKLNDVQMKFNLRDMRKRGAGPGSYEKLLTSLYDDFSMHYPELHELREASKLTAVARWLKGRHTWIKLPAGGLIHRSGPRELQGFIYLTWSPKSELIIASAMGGVSLINDDSIIPVDGSVVDLRPDHLADTPEDGLGILSRIIQPDTKAPVPRPVGWVTKEKIDGKNVTAVTLKVDDSERDESTEIQWSNDIEDNALVLWKTNDLEGAEEAYREQLKQLDNDPQKQAGIKLLLAQVLHEKGDDTAAIKLLKEATQIAPNHPMVHLMHAKALDEANDRHGAIEALNQYISMHPENKAAVRTLAEMESKQTGDSIKSGIKDILSEIKDNRGMAGFKPGYVRPEDAGLTSETGEKKSSLDQKYQEAQEIVRWKPKGMRKPMLIPAEITEHPNFQEAQKRPEFQEKGQKRLELVEKQRKLQKNLKMVLTLEAQEGDDNREELEKIKIRYEEGVSKLKEEIKEVDANIHEYLVNIDGEDKKSETGQKEKPTEGDKKEKEPRKIVPFGIKIPDMNEDVDLKEQETAESKN